MGLFQIAKLAVSNMLTIKLRVITTLIRIGKQDRYARSPYTDSLKSSVSKQGGWEESLFHQRIRVGPEGFEHSTKRL